MRESVQHSYFNTIYALRLLIITSFSLNFENFSCYNQFSELNLQFEEKKTCSKTLQTFDIDIVLQIATNNIYVENLNTNSSNALDLNPIVRLF